MEQRTENKEKWEIEIRGKIEVIIGGKMKGVCGEGMGGIRRGREEYRRVGGDICIYRRKKEESVYREFE